MYQQPWNPQAAQAQPTQQGFAQPQAQQQPQLPYSFPATAFGSPQFQQPQAPVGNQPGMLPIEQSYIENILRLNRGKIATVYMTFENNEEWNARIFRGRVEEAGRDHLIISNPETGQYYLLLMVNLDYVEFSEPLEYDYPYAYAPGQLSQYPPRDE
ncbi:spore coat protein GerQ [Halalkalibacter urbisdiaboli]|uniref:spore coat protein GerQ n=1 Tax=Halalkalibacter urbisdiaboli TaxID=1960589 RepID=UPI000B42E6A8|nr:spore coat protein GerQ [Halalkalibacter urbisdiaboli]